MTLTIEETFTDIKPFIEHISLLRLTRGKLTRDNIIEAFDMIPRGKISLTDWNTILEEFNEVE